MAGGTARQPGCSDESSCAYSINVDNFANDLQDALVEVALEAMSCSFDMPTLRSGAPDFDAVNITITSKGNSHMVSKDLSHNSGWDYLAGNKQVQLYGQPCEILKSDAAATVKIELGCKNAE